MRSTFWTEIPEPAISGHISVSRTLFSSMATTREPLSSRTSCSISRPTFSPQPQSEPQRQFEAFEQCKYLQFSEVQATLNLVTGQTKLYGSAHSIASCCDFKTTSMLHFSCWLQVSGLGLVIGSAAASLPEGLEAHQLGNGAPLLPCTPDGPSVFAKRHIPQHLSHTFAHLLHPSALAIISTVPANR